VSAFAPAHHGSIPGVPARRATRRPVPPTYPDARTSGSEIPAENLAPPGRRRHVLTEHEITVERRHQPTVRPRSLVGVSPGVTPCLELALHTSLPMTPARNRSEVATSLSPGNLAGGSVNRRLPILNRVFKCGLHSGCGVRRGRWGDSLRNRRVSRPRYVDKLRFRDRNSGV
jgi:hypothetical protein